MTMFRMLPRARIPAFVLGAILVSGGPAAADQVFNDDVIILGSECVGFDCVNGEVFGFATIKVKENNTRILFEDTSVGTFPTNDWQLTANDSASGGANKFSIEDITGVKVPFTIRAGAATDSIFVDSIGRVGFRTATPGLAVHANTSDSTGLRLEQNSSGGFTAQTWDIAGNEANFFVRDVTGGSRLPFRIRPGAPTSSIDISASGNVGMGSTSPTLGSANRQLTVSSGISGDNTAAINIQANATTPNGIANINGFNGANQIGTINFRRGVAANDGEIGLFSASAGTLVSAVRIVANGNVGVGTNTPAVQFHTTAGVRFAGITGCTAGIQSTASGDLTCLSSSRQFKTVAGDLHPDVALTNVMALRPQTGVFKTTPDVPEHWLIAEDVAAVDSALAGYKDGKPYTVKTQNVVADLVAVIQQQQRRIEALEKALAR